MDAIDFGERLRELREQAGLSQRCLAAKVGVNFSYISKIENGVKPPPKGKKIIRLAEVLKADKNELMALGGKIPSEILAILKSQQNIKLLRSDSGRTMMPTNKLDDFGIRLRELREQAGLNQRELGDEAGISFSYISKIESGGKPPPTNKMILQLATILEADIDELMALGGKVPSDIAQLLKNRDTVQSLQRTVNKTSLLARIKNSVDRIRRF